MLEELRVSVSLLRGFAVVVGGGRRLMFVGSLESEWALVVSER